MISPEFFLDSLKQNGIDFFCGVPDSLLKNFCACIDDNVDKNSHIITANEGNAIALAAGYHLATGNIGLVYMQNSGIGNSINPLTSLTDPEVYNIPLLLVIGWRGEPGVKDEPQHVKQGRISAKQLEILEIPYVILEAKSDVGEVLSTVFSELNNKKSPVAILVKAETFSGYKSSKTNCFDYPLSREEALRTILKLSKSRDLFVSTTGKTSRELYELRIERNEVQKDFLTVGAMGHTSSIALGVALGRPDKRVICIDGDGSMLMHMGALPVIGDLKPPNFVHIIINNASHESVGGQPTVAGNVDFKQLALACGYKSCFSANDADTLNNAWSEIEKISGPVMLEVRVKQGSRDNLSRPSGTPVENKKNFMDQINGR